jgi:hypothetical protein
VKEKSQAIDNGEAVILIGDFEELKVFDLETARPFISKEKPKNSFADERDPHDPSCPPPVYFSS